MKTKIISILALLLTVTQGAWATALQGSGTEADPYLIFSADDWTEFCTNFDTYKAGYVALAADISVGNTKTPRETAFSGTFNGYGHKLTVALSSSEGRCAPFQYVVGGTIKNLHVDGTITTTGGYSGGIVGACLQLTLTGCRSSVAFTGTGLRDIGGLVGCMNTNGKLIVTDCLFDGSINASETSYCAGIVGTTYQSGSNIPDATFTRCLVNPGTVSVGNGSYTIAFTTASIGDTNYYVTAIGAAQGNDASGMTAAQLAAALGSGWEVVDGKAVPKMPLGVLLWSKATNYGTFTMPAYDVEVNTELWYKLKQDGETPDGNKTKANVFLDRTLQAKVDGDDAWNTFCVPFPISAEKVTALGMTVKQLSGTSFSNGTLTLDFTDVTTGIEAGTPYLVSVASDLDFTADGNEFEGVSQDWTAYHEVTPGTDTGNDWVTFVPVLEKKEFTGEDKTALYLSGAKTLYYPSQEMTIKGFRAYFQLNNDLTAGTPAAGTPAAGIRAFVLNLGDEETGIQTIAAPAAIADGGTYSLDGRKVQNTTRKGIYIVNGKKVVVK